MNSTSVNSLAIAWRIGSIILQGPHHEAEKSITTFTKDKNQNNSDPKKNQKKMGKLRSKEVLRDEENLWVRWSEAANEQMSGKSWRKNSPMILMTVRRWRSRRRLRKRETNPLLSLCWMLELFLLLTLLAWLVTTPYDMYFLVL